MLPNHSLEVKLYAPTGERYYKSPPIKNLFYKNEDFVNLLLELTLTKLFSLLSEQTNIKSRREFENFKEYNRK